MNCSLINCSYAEYVYFWRFSRPKFEGLGYVVIGCVHLALNIETYFTLSKKKQKVFFHLHKKIALNQEEN
jgi:hypothetical protein